MDKEFTCVSLFEKRNVYGFPSQARTPALFLDRDGVVIEDRHYLKDPAKVRLCAGGSFLIQNAHKRGWPVIVITHQPGIARKMFSWSDYEQVNARMLEILGPDSLVTAV